MFLKLKSKSIIYNLKATRRAFTIVELIIVIAVIGILSGIVYMSSTSARNKAIAISLQDDLTRTASILEMDKIRTGSYPATLAAANGGDGVVSSGNNVFDYVYTPGADSYTLDATNGAFSYYVTSGNTTPTIGSSP